MTALFSTLWDAIITMATLVAGGYFVGLGFHMAHRHTFRHKMAEGLVELEPIAKKEEEGKKNEQTI